MAQDQGDHWRGMGHSQVTHGTGSGGEPDEQEGERSSSASSSGGAGFDYRVEPDGEVIPIGGEEEEEEEEEAGEEEGGGGDTFPPLPKNLDEIFTVHDKLLLVNDPDLSLVEWEIEYEPGENTTYLAIPFLQADRSGSPNLPGTLTATLNGKAPDVNSRTVFSTTAGNTARKYRGMWIWKEPEAGPIVIKLEGGEGTGIGQSHIVALPISVKGGINLPAATGAVAGASGGIPAEGPKAWADSYEPLLPSAYIIASVAGGRISATEPPGFETYWTGYKVYGIRISAVLGNIKHTTFEVILGLKPTGAAKSEGIWPSYSAEPTTVWAARTRGLMNL